jgi:hypothetical protein
VESGANELSAGVGHYWRAPGGQLTLALETLPWLWMSLTACLIPLASCKLLSLQVIGWENGRPAIACSKNFDRVKSSVGILLVVGFASCRFLLLAGYENLTAPLFALARQCKAEVTIPAPGSSP